MKFTLGFAFLIILIQSGFSQRPKVDYRDMVYTTPPDFYLSLSTGLDNYTGIFGLGALVRAEDNLFLRGGVGLGTWGFKLTGGLKYQNFNSSGFGFGLGYSVCSGVKGVLIDLPNDYGEPQSIEMDLDPAGSFNLTFNKNWVFKRGNVFYLETGYAIPTSGSSYYDVLDGSTLSSEAELILQILRPGGLIAAGGFLIAF